MHPKWKHTRNRIQRNGDKPSQVAHHKATEKQIPAEITRKVMWEMFTSNAMPSLLEFEWIHTSICVGSEKTPASNTHTNAQPLYLSSLYSDWMLAPEVPYMLQPTWRVSQWIDLIQIFYHMGDGLPFQIELLFKTLGLPGMLSLSFILRFGGLCPSPPLPCGLQLPHSQLLHHSLFTFIPPFKGPLVLVPLEV